MFKRPSDKKILWLLGVIGFISLLIGGLMLLNDGWPLAAESTLLNAPLRYPYATQTTAVTPILALEQEIAFYQERLTHDPNSGLNLAALAGAYFNMAKLSGGMNWYLLAEQAAHRSLASLPFNNEGAMLVLAQIASDKHRFNDALTWVDAILKQQPGHEDARALQVTVLLAQGEYAQANRQSAELAAQLPTSSVLFLHALSLVALGEEQKALDAFERALGLEEPGDAQTSAWMRTLLGRFYTHRGHADVAQMLFEEALRIVPHYPLALIQLAELHAQQNQFAEAQDAYEQVLRITQSNKSAQLFDHSVFRGLARLKAAQGDAASADAWWTKAETVLREHVDLSFGHRRELAQLLLERGQPQDVDEALALMKEEIEIRRDADTLATYAWALSEAGQWREAHTVMEELLAKGTQDPRYQERMEQIAQNLKDNAADS